MTRACYQLRRLPRPVRGSSGPIASTLSPASHSDAREKTMSTTHFDNPVSTPIRSEEHTSELQSLMRISYAVFCLKKKKQKNNNKPNAISTYKKQTQLRQNNNNP